MYGCVPHMYGCISDWKEKTVSTVVNFAVTHLSTDRDDWCLTWESDCYSCCWCANFARAMIRSYFEVLLSQYKLYSHIIRYIYNLWKCVFRIFVWYSCFGELSSQRLLSTKTYYFEVSTVIHLHLFPLNGKFKEKWRL